MVKLADDQPQTWGTPSDEELAAIVAALEQVWPRGSATVPKQRTPVWRFSGRWW